MKNSVSQATVQRSPRSQNRNFVQDNLKAFQVRQSRDHHHHKGSFYHKKSASRHIRVRAPIFSHHLLALSISFCKIRALKRTICCWQLALEVSLNDPLFQQIYTLIHRTHHHINIISSHAFHNTRHQLSQPDSPCSQHARTPPSPPRSNRWHCLSCPSSVLPQGKFIPISHARFSISGFSHRTN